MKTTDYAKWFLQKNPNLYYGYLDENLKLNKLLYFSDLMYYSITGEDLFEEKFERWDKGPVAPSVQSSYRYNGLNKPSPDKVSVDDSLKENVLNIINLLLSDWEPEKLSIATHNHNTWQTMARNEKYDYSKTNPTTLTFLKNIYSIYKDVDFNNLSKEVINGNIFIYDRTNTELTNEKLEELAGYSTLDSPVFVEEFDGELVLL